MGFDEGDSGEGRGGKWCSIEYVGSLNWEVGKGLWL